MGGNYTIVIKLGTSSLVDEKTREPRLANMSNLVETMVKLRRLGHRIIVVSSGAIAVGMRAMGLDKRPEKLATIQALASIGQGILIGLFHNLFSQLSQPVSQILLTRNDIVDFTQYRNAVNTINEVLEMGVIPIVNENDTLSVAEIKFGDNDTLSAITAGMMHADYLFLMTDVECLYTANPRNDPNAKPILIVDRVEDLKVNTKMEEGTDAGSSVGTGGMTTKLIAAELANSAGVVTVITLSNRPEYVLDIVADIQKSEGLPIENMKLRLEEKVTKSLIPLHTRFLALPRDSTISDKKFWLLHGLKTRGDIIVDQGCFKALTRQNRAGLLPAGIVAVTGDFHESECVSLKVLDDSTKPIEEARLIGHCRVNYSSVEVSLIKGCQSHQIEEILGFADSEYVAHRDNIAFPPIVVQPEDTNDISI